jgi:regulation of enolase protein 1 (concanavalin A-like superfamily)
VSHGTVCALALALSLALVACGSTSTDDAGGESAAGSDSGAADAGGFSAGSGGLSAGGAGGVSTGPGGEAGNGTGAGGDAVGGIGGGGAGSGTGGAGGEPTGTGGDPTGAGGAAPCVDPICDVTVVDVGRHEATILFETPTPTIAVIDYDLDTWVKSRFDDTFSTTHAIVLDQLMAGDGHDYRITVTDQASLETVDVVRSFSTAGYSAGALPNGWSSMDLGDVSATLPGSAIFDAAVAGGSFAVRGTGTNVYFDADSFHFVYHPVAGDFTFSLRVDGYYGYLHMWTKAMTMFRSTLTADSTMFNQSINYVGNDYLYFRDVPGAHHVDLFDTQLNPGGINPVWARLQRVGNTFTESYSTDGVNWVVNGPANGTTVALPTNGYVGFGTCSKSNDYLSEIVYSQVTLVD